MCTYMMTQMFVLGMLVCSAADALVVAAGCCLNIHILVHFAAAVFARGRSLPEVQKKMVLHLCNVLSSYFQCFNYYTVLPIYTILFIY